MKKSTLLAILTFWGFSVQAEEAKTLLSLNDVSILLPYDSIPELKTVGLQSMDFLPSWILTAIDKELKDDNVLRLKEFDAVSELEARTADQDEFLRAIDGSPEFEQAEISPMRDSNSFRLTSLRIDPCADQLLVKSHEDCTQELRLVWTEVHNKFGLRDSNIHAIYKVNRKDFQDIVNTLRELVRASGMDTTKEPLQTQPVIRAQGIDGSYYRGVIGLVQRFAKLSNLTHIAFMKDTMGGLQGHWPMLKFEVKDGQALRLPIVGARVGQSETVKFVQRMNGDRAILAMPSPLSTVSDNLFPEFAKGLQRLADEVAEEKIENSFRLENPRLHGVNDLDCASCHMAESERSLAARGRDGLKSEKAYTSKTWNLAVTTEVETTSLQIFSFFISKPRIAPRAINESAEAADMIHERF